MPRPMVKLKKKKTIAFQTSFISKNYSLHYNYDFIHRQAYHCYKYLHIYFFRFSQIHIHTLLTRVDHNLHCITRNTHTYTFGIDIKLNSTSTMTSFIPLAAISPTFIPTNICMFV